MIRADEFTAAFDVFALHEVGHAHDAPADALARLQYRDVVTGADQLMSGGQSGEPGADDRDPFVDFASGPCARATDEQARGCRERGFQHLAPRQTVVTLP
jgi:hypothetical protein